MVKSGAATPQAYLAELSPGRRETIARVREVILDNLPQGYEEGMHYGMIDYHIPLERYPSDHCCSCVPEELHELVSNGRLQRSRY